MGTSKHIESSAAFPFEVPERNLPRVVQELQMSGTSSSRHFLLGIRRPTLLLSAYDDPFLPREVLDDVAVVASRNPFLEVEFHELGGHVGFVSGRLPWRTRYYAEWRVIQYFAWQLDS